MQRKRFKKVWPVYLILALVTMNLQAKEVGIFFNQNISQYSFAANEIKKALILKGQSVELFDLDKLSADYPNLKVVITLKTDKLNLDNLRKENGLQIKELGEQSYNLRTTNSSKTSYWVFGGDILGAMYGGLQLAENINLYGLNKTFNEEESPYILNRGIKFNIPFDERSPTYYSSGFSEKGFSGMSTRKAISHVWDLNFWSEMFDELAMQRYNVISLWTLHPFTSMIKMPKYPDVALENVQGFNGFSKTMSIDEKIEFWKKVMILAKNRGIDFYLYNWNIYTYGATGKYGIDNHPSNKATVEYMRKCTFRLFETYPDLTGFGVTAGENMGNTSNKEEANWTWSTYGKGVYEFASAHPERKIVFVHRYHGAGADEVAANFKPLLQLPNVRFDFSFKYAVAHVYSTTTPNWIRTRNGDVPVQLVQLKLKTWLELRCDDFYYLHWGDPDFVKRYLAGFPDKDQCVRGFVFGMDGYTPTYTFTSKADWAKGKLEMKRLWYSWMLWGRLAYNPTLSDEFFQNYLGNKYPQTQQKELFTAWSEASKGVPLFTELIQGTWISDFLWYPEACMSRKDGFETIDNMLKTIPPPGSNLCSIAESAANNCGDKRSASDVADEIEVHAQQALKILGNKQSPLNTELGTNLGNIRALAYLSLYYAEKIRGAISKANSQHENAKESMGRAYRNWIDYSTLMDKMYTGQEFQRTRPITDWHMLDKEVLDEYLRLGGVLEGNDLNKIQGIKR